MSQFLSTHPDFIEAFVQICNDNGFNEKQASDLLDTYIKGELFASCPEFREGVESTIEKQATVWQAIKTLGGAAGKGMMKHPGITLPAAGGLVGGLASDGGILPPDWKHGVGTGAAIGGGLGMLGMLKNPALAFKALSRIGNAPLKGQLGAIGGVLAHPKFLEKGIKPLGKLAIGGGIAGGAAGLGQQLRHPGLGVGPYPNLDPNTGRPWYMGAGGQSGGGAGGGSTASDPYDLPSDIMDKLKNERGLSSGGGVGGGAGGLQGPMQDAQRYGATLHSIDQEIQQLQSSMPPPTDPSSFMQRQGMQTNIDRLKAQRALALQNLNKAQATITQDRQSMSSLAAEKLQGATQGLNSAQKEFSGLRDRLNAEQVGGVGGTLTKWYNQLTGAQDRMRALDPVYSGYNREIENAREMQRLSRGY